MRSEPLWFTVILVAAIFSPRISSHHTAPGAHVGATGGQVHPFSQKIRDDYDGPLN
jgi:hypothetical protein